MFYPAVSAILFYVFAVAAVLSAIGVVSFRNPVACALSMALCFGFTAAIFFNMGASFLGISQIIVYAGAILVLFLFIVMMLDVKKEEEKPLGLFLPALGVIVAGVFAGMMVTTSMKLPGAATGKCPARVLVESADALCLKGGESCCASGLEANAPYGGALPALKPQISDTKLLGESLFSGYSLAFVILSFALLAGAVGAVSVGRRLRKD